MPTDPLLPENRAFPRARSPDGTAGNERKRRRKVLSCWDCRRRKLSCDRAMPACGRCTKAGQAASCLYIEDATDVPERGPEQTTTAPAKSTPYYVDGSRGAAAAPAPSTAQRDLVSRLEFQDNRIKQLEAALAQAAGMSTVQRLKNSHFPPTPDSVAAVDLRSANEDRDATLLRGASFKTQFHGNTHPGALIAHIPELHQFTKQAFEEFPALRRIREDMRALEGRVVSIIEPKASTKDADLRALLPSKGEADELIRLYFDNYGGLYHVFHVPTFEKEYNTVFDDIENANAHSVAIILLMVAAAQCLTTAQPWLYLANSSSARERAIQAIQAVDIWLLDQSQKHVTAADFQIRVLSSLAKQVCARKFKRSWTDLGGSVRFCMAAGLHRSPDLIRKPTSALDKELRRRVWAAVTELELQAAFDRGLMSAPWVLQSDCPSPSHVDDAEIDQTTNAPLPVKRIDEWTNVSYLTVCSETTILRTSINTYLNNIRQTVSFEETKRYTDEIQSHLADLPDWTTPASEVPRALLSLNLRQYLLVLHDRQYRSCDTKSERDFSKMILVETATTILEIHKSLTSKGCYALELLCSDQLRAALSICHVTASLDPRADDAFTATIRQSAARLIPEAIDMLTEKVIRFGREQRQLWILVAANGFMKSRADPNKKLLHMQEAVDKITRPYYKIMACQEEQASAGVPQQAAITAGSTPSGETGRRMLEQYPSATNADGMGDASMMGRNGTTDPALLDFDEIAAWTFEDWSFNPFSSELAQPYNGPM